MPNDDEFIKVKIDDKEVKRAFRNLINRGEDLSPVTAEIANHLYNLTAEAFENESDYLGVPWERLSDATKKAKGHEKMLFAEGTMQESLKADNDGNSAIVGVNAYANDYPYPAVQQFGSKNGDIPARRYFPFDEDEELYSGVIEEIITLLEDYLEG